MKYFLYRFLTLLLNFFLWKSASCVVILHCTTLKYLLLKRLTYFSAFCGKKQTGFIFHGSLFTTFMSKKLKISWHFLTLYTVKKKLTYFAYLILRGDSKYLNIFKRFELYHVRTITYLSDKNVKQNFFLKNVHCKKKLENLRTLKLFNTAFKF